MDVNQLFEEAKETLQNLWKKWRGISPVEPLKEEMNEGVSIGEEFIAQGLFGDEESRRTLAEELGLPVYTDLSDLRLSRETYRKVPYAFAKRHLVLPIQEEDQTVIAVCADPLGLEPLEDLRIMLGKPVKAAYASKDTIMTAINNCYNIELGETSQMIAGMQEGTEDGDGDGEVEVYDLLDDSQGQAPIIKLINLILVEAIQQGASDIHFEPMEDGLHLRYRIDGTLHDRHTPAAEYQTQLVTRVKVMAKLDIAERRLPQDGRIKLRMGRREIDFRISTIPTVFGERIVMRVLDKGNITLGLERLGMPSEMLQEFSRLIRIPEGIVLVTGPTGSGKTTSLYSALTDISGKDVNIMTVEDPVEYILKGIAQIGVRPKINLTFATGLRHILRQDPDIIMIGEIRDTETAEIAIQAALTGHLVLSTLHTNDAPSAITRLVDMGVEPYLLSSTIVGVLAQRLVRKICSHCKQPVVPTSADLQALQLKEENLTFYAGKGCDTCFGSGYSGRHGVYELMTVNHVIHQQIVKSPDAVELRHLAIDQGMMSLREHGIALVKAGITTVAEILRVIRTIEER